MNKKIVKLKSSELKFQPVEYKVLVKPLDKQAELKEKYSHVVIPDTVVGKEQLQQDKAVIVAVGGRAFEDFGEPKPKPGDTVLMSRHSGYLYWDGEGKDREEYRIINDKDVTMILGG